MTSPGSRGDLALVTGASSGIGEVFAYRLAGLGYDLVITARREDRLKEVAAKIKAEHGRDVRVIVAELGNRDGLARVIDAAANEPLDMLVNNAGLAHYKPFLELPPDEAEELMLVNTLAPTLLARAALPGMVARGSGTIINLSSMLAFSGTGIEGHLPRRAVYAATRAYMLALSQLLQGELQGSGIYVQALCPAVVRTEFPVARAWISRVGPASIPTTWSPPAWWPWRTASWCVPRPSRMPDWSRTSGRRSAPFCALPSAPPSRRARGATKAHQPPDRVNRVSPGRPQRDGPSVVGATVTG